MNNKILEKLNNDLKKLDVEYTRLLRLDLYENERENPDKEFLEYLRNERIKNISKELYIKELLEVVNEK